METLSGRNIEVMLLGEKPKIFLLHLRSVYHENFFHNDHLFVSNVHVIIGEGPCGPSSVSRRPVSPRAHAASSMSPNAMLSLSFLFVELIVSRVLPNT